LLGVEALRRQYLDAIRASYEMIEIWLGHLMSDCNNLNIDFMVWANIFIVRYHYVEVVREPNAEIQSNDLDLFIQDFNFSDSESSSCESEIASAENEHTSDIMPDIIPRHNDLEYLIHEFVTENWETCIISDDEIDAPQIPSVGDTILISDDEISVTTDTNE